MKLRDKFIVKAKKIYGDLYTYENLVYHPTGKICITCRLHGDFYVQSNSYLHKGHDCQICRKERDRKRSESKYLSELVDVFGKDHTIKLLDTYVNKKTPIRHINTKCNHITTISPISVIKNRTKCKECSMMKVTEGNTKTHEEYLKEIENTEFEALELYVNYYTKIEHRHKVCGYTWKTYPYAIKRGGGCPKCASHGFNITKPANLYYLHYKSSIHEFWKIGITNREVEDRYSKVDKENIEFLYTKHFKSGMKAYKEEQDILAKYKNFKVKDMNFKFTDSTGMTECFYLDIREQGFLNG